MLILQSSAEKIELMLEPEDGRFWLLLRDVGVNCDGVENIIVTISRGGLTDEICIENFDREREREARDSGQSDLFP